MYAPLVELACGKSGSSEEETLNCTGDPAEELSSDVKSRGDSATSQWPPPKKFNTRKYTKISQKK